MTLDNTHPFPNIFGFLSEKFQGKLQQFFQTHFAKADIQINGMRPWDIQIHDPRFYPQVLFQGSLGLGETYVKEWWDCLQLDIFFEKLLRHRLQETIRSYNITGELEKVRTVLMNLQSLSRSFQVGHQHYNLGNDLYQKMLDSRLIYSCGYWKDAKTLEEAQTAKLDLICRKLKLEKGMTLLDIGCGWGGLMKYAAEHYGVSCVGITVSEEQMALGKELCLGLPIEFRLQDYRELEDQFDRIASVGMVEHVGYKNYRTFMEIVYRCLKDEGIFLLHTIGNSKSVTYGELWIDKYIFPNGMLPSLAQLSAASEELFVIEDVHNFGQDYAPTLKAWYQNFEKHWQELQSIYGKQFYRIWKYYLLSSVGGFSARFIQLWQIILTKHGLMNGYEPVR